MDPKVSIITPSFNQAGFLESTIKSVLDQHYSKLEYQIFDGGSRDGSLEIIKMYSDKLSYWEIKKDNGQSHAVNKGFERASGDILSWINSDDIINQGSIHKIVTVFNNPEIKWLTGDCEVIDEKGKIIGYYRSELPNSSFHWLNMFVRGYSCSIIQPSTFWRREVINSVGNLNESLHYSFDHEFFYRVYKAFGPPFVINEPLSQFRLHDQSKTNSKESKFRRENMKIGLRYARGESLKNQLYLFAVNFRERVLHG